MNVRVTNHYDETERTLSGAPDKVLAELLRLYPWLRSESHRDNDLQSVLEELAGSQAYDVEVDGEIQELGKRESDFDAERHRHVLEAQEGYRSKMMNAFEAARFLAGKPTLPAADARRALYQHDGDVERAALSAHGLDVTPENLRALRGVCGLRKAEELSDFGHAEVQAGHPDAQDVAQVVQRGCNDDFVVPVELGGKHSAGSVLVRDPDTQEVWLLKPGSGGQDPAAGDSQDPSSQSRREAAYYHAARALGLEEYFPESQLLLVNGKEYAAIRLLPWSYRGLDKVLEEAPTEVRHVLDRYRSRGVLHMLGALDYVLGNPDRHAGNVMEREGDLKLIDHGSAFAGSEFDPARDRNTFVPFYLRYASPRGFSSLALGAKLSYMPRVSEADAVTLHSWIESIDAAKLRRVLVGYGIDPAPAEARLARLKLVANSVPADLAINKLWVEL